MLTEHETDELKRLLFKAIDSEKQTLVHVLQKDTTGYVDGRMYLVIGKGRIQEAGNLEEAKELLR